MPKVRTERYVLRIVCIITAINLADLSQSDGSF